MIAFTVLMLGTVIAVAQNTGGYKILNGNVYYNNVILHEADPNTIQDLLPHLSKLEGTNSVWKLWSFCIFITV